MTDLCCEAREHRGRVLISRTCARNAYLEDQVDIRTGAGTRLPAPTLLLALLNFSKAQDRQCVLQTRRSCTVGIARMIQSPPWAHSKWKRRIVTCKPGGDAVGVATSLCQSAGCYRLPHGS